VEELSKQVDSLIVVLNDKLLEVYGDDAGFEDCFRSADNVLTSAVGGIAEIINVPGLVNVDFQDVRTAMAEMGRAMMGSAQAVRSRPCPHRRRAGCCFAAPGRYRAVRRPLRADQHHRQPQPEDVRSA
jgi:cell division GTPase FtsZ